MKQWRQMISGLLIICMLIAMIPVNVSADMYIPAPEEEFTLCDPVEIETAVPEISYFGLDENGLPEMKDSNEVRWIDRIKDLPEYAEEFYGWLEENSDADGTEDALIDVTQGISMGANTYVHKIGFVAASADFTFDPATPNDMLNSVMDEAANAAIKPITDQIKKELNAYAIATLNAFDRDHPEVFWMEGTIMGGVGTENGRWNYDLSEGTGTMYRDVVYYYYLQAPSFDTRAAEYCDPDTIYNTISEVEPMIEKVVNGASGTRKEKLDYFNDWLTKNNCYNTSSDLNTIGHDTREIVSVFKGIIGEEGPVCEAYARGFKVLCDRINVPCVLVSGDAGGPHMWNNVQMNDGKWYAVDVTWNDPLVYGVTQAVSNYENDDYFLVGANTNIDGETFEESHIVTNHVSTMGPKFLNGPVLEDDKFSGPLAELAFAGASLELKDDLSIRYMVKASLFEEGVYTDPYIIVELNGVETKITDYMVDGDYYVFRFDNIAPHQMNDKAYATIYATYDGKEYASVTRDYSVATYCYSMLEKCKADTYAEFRTLLVDLLHYGAKTQLFVNYNTDNLVDANLTDAQRAWGTQIDRELVSVLDPKYETVDNPTASWRGAGLNLQESIKMRVVLAADNIDGLSVKVTCDGKEWNIPAEEFTLTSDGYEVLFDGLNAAQLSEEVYVTVYKDGAAVSNTARYSVESYAWAKQSDANTKLADLVKTMMKYGDAVKEYVN